MADFRDMGGSDVNPRKYGNDKKLFKYKKKLARQESHERKKERHRERKESASMESTAEKNAERARQQRLKTTQEGYKQGEEFFARPQQGLTPEVRKAMQYEAERNLEREHQNAERNLMGEQSRHGIVGQGGIGYAQRRDLAALAQEGRGAIHRDLDRLNHDLALKKQAAIFNVGQGEATQSNLERQQALDELRYEQERKQQKDLLSKLSRNFYHI